MAPGPLVAHNYTHDHTCIVVGWAFAFQAPAYANADTYWRHTPAALIGIHTDRINLKPKGQIPMMMITMMMIIIPMMIIIMMID